MKRFVMVLGILGLLSLIIVPASAQQDDDGARQRGRRGQAGMRGPDGGQRGPGDRGGRMGQPGDRGMGGRMGMMGARGGTLRGYVETNEESRALWLELRDQQVALHDAQWHLFEVLNNEPVNQDEVKAQLEILREINGHIRELNEKLEPYRQRFDEDTLLLLREALQEGPGPGAGPGWGQERGPREGQGRRPRRGQGGQQQNQDN